MLESLNEYGVRERALKDNINKVVQQEQPEEEEEEEEEGSEEAEARSEVSQEMEHKLFSLEETRKKMLQVESLFSSYLRSKNQQWESKAFREQVLRTIATSQDVGTLARQLLVINEKFIYIQTIVRVDPESHQTRLTHQSLLDEFNSFPPDSTQKKLKIKKQLVKLWGFQNDCYRKIWANYGASVSTQGQLLFLSDIFEKVVSNYVEKKQHHLSVPPVAASSVTLSPCKEPSQSSDEIVSIGSISSSNGKIHAGWVIKEASSSAATPVPVSSTSNA